MWPGVALLSTSKSSTAVYIYFPLVDTRVTIVKLSYCLKNDSISRLTVIRIYSSQLKDSNYDDLFFTVLSEKPSVIDCVFVE